MYNCQDVEIEVGFNNPSNKSAPQEKKEVPKQMFITNQPPASENELTEQLSDPKLNIIRTIEVIDTKIHESVKNSNSKNAEKQERKEVLQVHPKTTSLFLRYNKLTSLDGLRDTLKIVFPAYEQLMWIDLSHNRLTVLVDDFQALPLLKNLYLHANYINNFKELEKLVPVKLLRTFTIHGNPIENYS